MLLPLHLLWTPITVILFILIVRPRSNPLVSLADALLTGIASRTGRIVLAVSALALVVNFVECLFELPISRALGYDLTAWVRSIEGATVERVQATLPRSLAPPLSWFYLSGFVAILIAPVVVWTVEGRWRALAALIASYLANYALAMSAYLFFPVREVAWSGISGARPLLESLFAGISAETRAGSALDNCFPSLHVSLTVTVLLVALSTRDHAMRGLAAAVAVLTAYAVMALGIHWALDVVSGLVFGAVCAGLGLWLGPRLRERAAALES